MIDNESQGLSPALIARARSFSAATLHEAAGRIGALPGAIKPTDPTFRCCGPAFTVSTPPGDNFPIHQAIDQIHPGDILVIATGGGYDFGYWGEILSQFAVKRMAAGVVIDGGARDSDALSAVGLPIFSRGLCILGTSKDPFGAGTLGRNIRIGHATISPGDLVAGDVDGVVVIPKSVAQAVVEAAKLRDTREAEIIKLLANGESTMRLYGLESPSLNE